MSHEDCPGVPYDCEGALERIEKALDGQLTSAQAADLRAQFAHCQPCLGAFDLEVRLHVRLSEQCQEQAPAGLKLRIDAALLRIDLTQVEITDL
jgi:mycothiol system anti-sigma-R factor